MLTKNMIEAAPKRNILSALIVWHFSTAARGFAKAWRNFLVFNLRYFPVAELFRTLFSHWKRSVERYSRGLDIGAWARTFLGNMISRVIGAVVRLVIIIVGLVVEVFIFFAGLFMVLIWIFLPVLVLLGFFAGIGLLFGL